MTDKEKIELINLRNRLRSQREEIKRLMAENAELKKRLFNHDTISRDYVIGDLKAHNTLFTDPLDVDRAIDVVKNTRGQKVLEVPEEIKQLYHQNMVLEGQLNRLRSRCEPGAEKYFDKDMYGLLTITTKQRSKRWLRTWDESNLLCPICRKAFSAEFEVDYHYCPFCGKRLLPPKE